MGHQINYTTIPVNYDKSKIKAGMDERAWHDHWQESSEGLPSDIRWIDFVCDNKEQAREYIEKHENRLKSYDDKIKIIKKEIEKEQRIADQKGNSFWLVKTEYHC